VSPPSRGVIIKTCTHYVIERKTAGPEWEPWAFPKNDRLNALETLEWCRKEQPGGTFRLIFETREHIAAE
jgi:hypothetical protein